MARVAQNAADIKHRECRGRRGSQRGQWLRERRSARHRRVWQRMRLMAVLWREGVGLMEARYAQMLEVNEEMLTVAAECHARGDVEGSIA